MSKEISFSEFLKEGALREEKKVASETARPERKPFHIEPEEVKTESEVREFWKRLRHFFRTGESPNRMKGAFVPALIAPYLQNEYWDSEFPFYYNAEVQLPLESLANIAVKELFKEKEAKILRENIQRWLSYARAYLNEQNGYASFKDVKAAATAKLLKLDVHGEQGDRFKEDVAKWNDALPSDGYALDFSHDMTLRLMQFNLDQIANHRAEYKKHMAKTLAALKEMVKAKKKKSGEEDTTKGFDFASDMIALDKVTEMTPKAGSKVMDEHQLKRINQVIEVLEKTVNSAENEAHLIVQDSLKDQFDWTGIFSTCKVSFEKVAESLKHAQSLFDANIGSFAEVLIAMRKAELDLAGKYKPEVHDDFFAHFKWFKLEESELQFFPPVVVFADADALMNEGMAEFSKLLVSVKPINVVAFTTRSNTAINPEIDWEDASHTYRQELAAFSLSHRGAHTLQCSTDKPSALYKGVTDAFTSVSPSLMHLMLPEPQSDTRISFLKINAASAGRHFPFIAYDSRKGAEWGSRFDISANAQSAKEWPDYAFKYINKDGNEEQCQLTFTYGDYKAMSKQKVEELFMVPEAMVTNELIPVHEYLTLSQNQTSGKVPFIWLIDEDNRMQRAAVPYMWIVSCFERLDYWNFIQDVGGVNSYHVNKALAEAKTNWENEKTAELEAIEALHQKALETAKNEAASIAMENLANVLLDLDNVPAAPIKAKKPETKTEKLTEVKEEKAPEPEVKKAEPEVNAKAYIDSFKCTSCNDCIEKYPAIFTYNEDKQAMVNDASKGTYANLVDAAEGCPAHCIHPGLPLNKSEADLDSLIQRAAKFN